MLKEIELERRLNQTFAVTEEEYSSQRYTARMADVRRIKISRASVRKYFDPKEIRKRAQSIQSSGNTILKPLSVRYVPGDSSFEKFELFAGEITFRAAQLLGLEKVPVEIYDISEAEARMLSLTDNTTQVPLTIREQIDAVAELAANGFSLSAIAQQAGTAAGSEFDEDGSEESKDDKKTVSLGWAQNRLDASKASPAILSILDARPDGLSHVLLIHRDTHVFKHPQLEARLIRFAKQDYSIRELKAIIANHKKQAKLEKETGITTTSRAVTTEPAKPIQSVQGTVEQSNYDPIRKPAENRGETITDRAAYVNAAADELREQFGQTDSLEMPPRGETFAPAPDPVPAMMANALDTLAGVMKAYNASDNDSAREQLAKQFVALSHQVAYQIEEVLEN